MQKQQNSHTNQLEKRNVLGPVAGLYNGVDTGTWRLERPVVRFEECIKCGTCKMYCPTGVIEIDKDAKECVAINLDYCKGCGICAAECPKKCIDMVNERSVE